MPYYVYIIEIDKEFGDTRKAKQANPQANPDKPCIYIGSTSKKPEERFNEHMIGKRNNKGPIYSKVVYKFGIRLRPRLYEKCNPLKTRAEAEMMEKELTEKFRKRGYTVWSN